MKFKRVRKLPLKTILLVLVIFLLGVGFGVNYVAKLQSQTQSKFQKNTPKAFISEIYDKIKDNYWDKISDAELLELFRLSIDQQAAVLGTQNVNQLFVSKFENKDKLLEAVLKVTKNLPEEQKSKFIAAVATSVLSSLNPQGRSGLYTQALEQQLKNTVSNINPQKDLYKDLGLPKGASEAAVAQAFEKKSEQLKEDKSPQAKEKLKEITYAKNTLTQKETKLRYDTNQVEPTIFSRIPTPGVLYLQFKKFSPTSLEEFQKAFDLYKNDSSLNGLVLDLRGNAGGAIDATAYFLGFFLGKGQYAFDFYHKGDYLPFKTPTDKLPSLSKYKQVVVLVDQNTQSSAEMMAASIKKYHIGVVVGVPTKGWGTVERVFPLDNQISTKEKYSIFLVHSITLRDDNLPIEGRGVEPDINLNNSNWEDQVFSYFRNPILAEAIKTIL